MTTGILSLFVLLRLGVQEAEAFCGAYVGGATSNGSSIVVLVRDGNTNTLTLVNDFSGAESTFGYIMPVPPSFSLSDVTTVDPAVIERLDAYSAPREVTYTCDDVLWTWSSEDDTGHWVGSTGGCGGDPTPEFVEDTSGDLKADNRGIHGDGSLSGVQTTQRTTLGAYELQVVQASGSDGLSAWLEDHGFEPSPLLTTRLATYINGGQHFLVAQIHLEEIPVDARWLEPLRLRYDSPSISLPIWLGAASSVGVQDLLIFGISRTESGALAISNYPSANLEDECLTEDVNATLNLNYDAFAEAEGEASWVSEFGWLGGKCDPCPENGALDPADVALVGGENFAPEEIYFTRLHLRYRPEQIDEDLALYESGEAARWQSRYISASPEMSDFFPLCEGSSVSGWGECAPPDPPETSSSSTPEEEPEGSGCACPGASAAFLLGTLGFATRRRR